ncbi:MAG: D-alanyl-D-alanine carboxypeptidase/D-alanyl-D-alanine-endopeptidase [Bacteroidota bacterium]|jgi:D-alanyl-D-alanine carboxypeptidase/D-alanyl-D-alanine-endopeptidase (penicillin-binding protein 4)
MRIKFLFLFLVSLLSIVKSQSTVDQILNDLKKDINLKHASFGFCILDAQTGITIKEHHSELALIPASTLKIVTTGAALGILKKDFVYQTIYSILYHGESLNTSDRIGLKVKGVGDPSFNSSYFYHNDSLFFDGLIKKIKQEGIKKIDTIMIDDACFDERIPNSWIWADIANYFGAGANGLSYKDNKFSVFFSTLQPNTLAKIEAIKPAYFSKKINIESEVIAVGTEDEAFVFGDPDGFSRKIFGSIPPNKQNYEVEAQMPKPTEFFKFDLIQNLSQHHLYVNDGYTTFDKKINTKQIYTHTSNKLDKIIFYTNTKSNNHYAESLLKTVGGLKNEKQGTTQNGIEAVKSFWKSKGLDLQGLHMVDGSGLSRENTITTKLLAQILSVIYNDSLIYDAFNASLPIAGKNGSMMNLCKGTFAENNMRAKTGYINRARGYSGYVKTKKGKTLAFSVLFNNFDCTPTEMKLKIEKLLVALTEF